MTARLIREGAFKEKQMLLKIYCCTVLINTVQFYVLVTKKRYVRVFKQKE